MAADHAILRQKKLSRAKTGRDVVHHVLGDTNAGKIAIAANQIRLARFSQDQELQADAVGIRMIGNAGYDPFAAARFLETMKRYRDLRSRQQGSITDGNFLSSHPTTPNRINLARKHARFFGAPGSVGNVDRERYLRGIDGLLYGDAAKEGYVRGQDFYHGGLGVAFTAPKSFVIQNQSKAVVLSGPGQLASRFDATVMPPERDLVDYLKSGWVNGLIDESVVGERIGGLEGASGVALSDNWRFRVHIIRNGNQIYRFITAGPQTNLQVDSAANQIANSLRTLSPLEVANLKPLRVRVVTAQPGDNLSILIAQMDGLQQPLSVFRTINALRTGASIQPGKKYKIISE